jgi:hypothetical protein
LKSKQLSTPIATQPLESAKDARNEAMDKIAVKITN